MIIIAGDSWACGELEQGVIVHPGLTKFLIDDGYTVINCGILASTNFSTLDRLSQELSNLKIKNLLTSESFVIVFQTEWYRDYRKKCHTHMNGFVTSINNEFFEPAESLSTNFIVQIVSRWQYKLSELAQQFNVKIYLVGGCSDTMWLDQFETEYPGLSILCQSLTEYLITGKHRINNPVFTVKYPSEFVELCKLKCKNTTETEYLLSQVEIGIQRENLWKSTPEFFWPDGVHANRTGHYKLYQYIKETLLLHRN